MTDKHPGPPRTHGHLRLHQVIHSDVLFFSSSIFSLFVSLNEPKFAIFSSSSLSLSVPCSSLHFLLFLVFFLLHLSINHPASIPSTTLLFLFSSLFLSIFVFCLVRCLKCPPSPSSSSPLSLLAPLPRRLFLPLSHLSLPPFVTFVLLFLLFPAF